MTTHTTSPHMSSSIRARSIQRNALNPRKMRKLTARKVTVLSKCTGISKPFVVSLDATYSNLTHMVANELKIPTESITLDGEPGQVVADHVTMDVANVVVHHNPTVFCIKAAATMTVGDLKGVIAKKTPIPIRCQCIIHGGGELTFADNDVLLSQLRGDDTVLELYVSNLGYSTNIPELMSGRSMLYDMLLYDSGMEGGGRHRISFEIPNANCTSKNRISWDARAARSGSDLYTDTLTKKNNNSSQTELNHYGQNQNLNLNHHHAQASPGRGRNGGRRNAQGGSNAQGGWTSRGKNHRRVDQ